MDPPSPLAGAATEHHAPYSPTSPAGADYHAPYSPKSPAAGEEPYAPHSPQSPVAGAEQFAPYSPQSPAPEATEPYSPTGTPRADGGATPPLPDDANAERQLWGSPVAVPRHQTYSAQRFFQGWIGAERTKTDDVGQFSVTPAGTARIMAQDLADLVRDPNARCVDGCACLGGDTAALSRVFGGGVAAIEHHDERFKLLENNLHSALGLTSIRCMHGSCVELAPRLQSHVYYLDPPWGGRGVSKQSLEVELAFGDTPLHEAVRPDRCPRGCVVLAIKAPPKFSLHKFRKQVGADWAWHWSGAYLEDKIHLHVFRRISPTERRDNPKARAVRCRDGQTRIPMTKARLQRYVDAIVDRCRRSQLQQGDAIGQWAASGVGESVTQDTLHAIHVSGGGHALTEATGIPRMDEIVQASNPKLPVSRIAIVPGINVTERKVQAMASTPLSAILSQYYLIHDPVQSGPPWTRQDRDVPTCSIAAAVHGSEQDTAVAQRDPDDAALIPSEYVVRFELAAKVCRERGITPEMVAQRMFNLPQAQKQPMLHATVVFSGASSPVMVVRLRPWAEAGGDQKVLTEQFGNWLVTYCEQQLEVGGVRHIRKTSIHKKKSWFVGPDGSLRQRDLSEVLATGSSLTAISRFSWVDWYNCDTSDTAEILQVLGLMACRFAMQRELRKVLCGNAKVSKIDERHIRLLAYSVTTRGFLVVMTRHGFNREPNDAMRRMVGEQVYGMLAKASQHGQSDELSSSVSSIMVNARAPVGTGVVSVLADRSQERTRARFAKAQYGHLVTRRQRDQQQRKAVEEVVQRTGIRSYARARKRLRTEQAQWPAPPDASGSFEEFEGAAMLQDEHGGGSDDEEEDDENDEEANMELLRAAFADPEMGF